MCYCEKLIADFIEEIKNGNVELYNEFSFQHELGIYLRNKLPQDYKVQFERNVNFFRIEKGQTKTIKKEIDIVIFNSDKSEKYAIELKYPRNGQHPEQMYAFIKDILFMEQLQQRYGFKQTFAITLVDDKLFVSGKKITDIYQYFRKGENNEKITGEIKKPTGKKKKLLRF